MGTFIDRSAEEPNAAQSKVVQKRSIITEPFTVYGVRGILINSGVGYSSQ